MRVIHDQGLRQRRRGCVFVHIGFGKLCDGDLLNPGGDQISDMTCLQPKPLAQASRWHSYGMRQQRPFGVACGDLAELHGFLRPWIICARIDTAISGGPDAPISSPIGPAIRSICREEKPASSSLATREAWVRRDPRAPT